MEKAAQLRVLNNCQARHKKHEPQVIHQSSHLLHRPPRRSALVKDAAGVVPVGEVLRDLTQRREHAHASVLQLRRAVPLHLLGGAVLAEVEGVENASGLNVITHEAVHGVECDGGCGALLSRHLEAVVAVGSIVPMGFP